MSSLRKSNESFPYFGMVYGKGGVGKTSLVSNAKKPFFVGNELNREFDVLGFEPCKDYKQFLLDLDNVVNHVDKFDTLVIDNISDIEGMLKKDFLNGQNIALWGQGFGAGYTKCEEKIRNEIFPRLVKIRDLGKNIVILCHAKEKHSVDRLTGEPVITYAPDLENKSLKPFEAYADFIFHIHCPRYTDTKDKSRELRRVIYTTPSSGSEAKRKSFIDVPDEIHWLKEDTGLFSKLEEKMVKGKVNKKKKAEKKEGTVKKEKAVDKGDMEELYTRATEASVAKLPPLETILKEHPIEYVRKKLTTIAERNA